MSAGAVELGSGEQIPVIDFTGLTAGDLVLRKTTAMGMREAFEDFGFIYLKNDSVPQSVIDELFARSIAFFDLPQTRKAEAGGYRGAGLSGLDPSKPTDVKERFRAPYDSNLPPGYWPERFPNFREAISVFHEAGLLVLRQVMRSVALSLGLPEEYFDAAHEPHSGAVMLLHYPPITQALLPGQLRSGAHTDFGTMTLLVHHGSAEGLEIQRPGKKFALNSFGSASDYAVYTFFSKNGLDPNRDVTFLTISGTSARFAALVGGAVDATVVSSPFEYIAEQQGFRTLISLKELAEHVNLPYAGVAVTQEKIAKDGGQIVKVLRALRAAMMFIREQRAPSIELLAKTLKLNPAVAERFYPLYRELYNPELTISDSILEEFIAVGSFRLKDKEKIKELPKIQVLRDWSFAEKAKQ
jgi:ABC-type nitrate/sulfonate/bicarbonate transport system substrate-binding protein